MIGAMKTPMVGFFTRLLLVAGACYCQTQNVPVLPARHVEIRIPPGVKSETLFIRYVLTGEDFGGWVQPVSGVSSYVMSTTRDSGPATGMKAILYAPGCAIQTLDLALNDSINRRYTFICLPLSEVSIEGALVPSSRLYGQEVQLQARYVVRWASAFLGLADRIATNIPVGNVVQLPTDGHFRLVIPDLSQDPLAGSPDRPGELQIWAKDKFSDVLVTQLRPLRPPFIKTQLGGLRVQKDYPFNIAFCTFKNESSRRLAEGFAIRPAKGDVCD